MDVQVAFGGIIKRHRERAGWTQAELAERMGVARTTVTHLESGARMPSFPMLDKLGKALGLTVHVRLVETR
jgi:putative transcriptional regulator